MTYNALDMKAQAEALRKSLILERDDIQSSLSYEYATSWCDDCPLRKHVPSSYEEEEFGVPIASHCCKEDPYWEEEHKSDWDHVERITKLIEVLSQYLGANGRGESEE